jgi:regulatory protein
MSKATDPKIQSALIQMQAFCAGRDRAISEVRTKLRGLHVYGDVQEEILSALIAEDFLNEERFARSYARGQFRINQWGRQKIIHGLRGKSVDDAIIQRGLGEIDEGEYFEVLDTLILKHLKGAGTYTAKQKAALAMQRKGFEAALIWDRIRLLEKGKTLD